MSWYQTGYDAATKEEQRIQSASGPNRLWIKAGTGREIVLVDDEPFCIQEHNAKINNSWQNHHTCNKGLEESCFSCQHLGEKSKAFTGYLTCVDCTEYIDKKGNKHQFELKLVGGKLSMVKKWQRKKQDRGSLILSKWKIHREDDKKPSIGDEWEGSGSVQDPEKMFALANYRGKKLSEMFDKAEQHPDSMALVKRLFQVEVTADNKLVRQVPAFNYMEILKPRGNAWARDLLAGVSRDEATGGSKDPADNDGRGNEEEIPF